VRLNGRPVAWTVRHTARGDELIVDSGSGGGRSVLQVRV